MDDSALTSQAIAELMREMPLHNNQEVLGPQERKINPLGRPNKRFLGRTINTALRHNKRETERTHASCQQKLLEMDERHNRRMRNEFYTRNTSRQELRRSKRRSRSYSPQSSSRSKSLERKSRKKHKKRSKKKEKRKKRQRSNSNSSSDGTQQKQREEDDRSHYLMPPNNLALAVAMAYSQALTAQQKQALAKVEIEVEDRATSPLSDIIKELQSDEEVEHKALYVASSSEDEVQEMLTINLSSQEELSADTEADSSSSSEENGSCIALEESAPEEEQIESDSDLEIIEIESKEERLATPVLKKQAAPADDLAATVDLTGD